MKVKYVENNQMYLITNHAVARNAIFKNSYFESRLKIKIHEYLDPICDIVSIRVHADQFQLIVRLGSRERFIEFYREKGRKEIESVVCVPKSTYIFSQVMANLQSSIALHFNRKSGRTGAVFARRFTKIKIRCHAELEMWKERFKKGLRHHYYQGKWAIKRWRAKKDGTRNTSSRLFKSDSKELQGPLAKHHKFDLKKDVFFKKTPKKPDSS